MLNQDFRTATFFLRPDTSNDGFRFAHTSLLEYFLASWLVKALDNPAGTANAWNLPMPSDEALDFAGQLLDVGDSHEALGTLSSLLDDAGATAEARRAALRYWLVAADKGWPVPEPKAARLDGLDLEKWNFRGLDLRGATFAGSDLRHAVFESADLAGADFSGADATLAEFHQSPATASQWRGADLTGSTWRNSSIAGADCAKATLYDAWFIEAEAEAAHLPPFPDRQLAVSGSGSQPNDAVLSLPQGHSGSVLSCAFSPDGSQLLSAGQDRTLRLWDAKSGRCLLSLNEHSGPVLSCAFSPDGSQLLSAGQDRTLRLWDAKSGRLLRTWVIQASAFALADLEHNEILGASPGGWRLLAWRRYDPEAGRLRLYPAEMYGPLPEL